MEKENAKKKPDIIEELIDSELHDDEVQDTTGSENIESAIQGVLNEQNETYGVNDVLLRKPYSTLKVTPEGMYAFAGNENGEMHASTDKAYIAAFTDIGYGKHKNDDGLLVDPESNTVSVPDGVGGNKHGEVASAVSVHTMGQLLDNNEEKFDLEASGNKMHTSVKEYQQNNGEDYSKIGATFVELHTGRYCEAASEDALEHEFQLIATAAEEAHQLGLRVFAGHGLDYQNTAPIAALDMIEELSIGHAIISRAVFTGLDQAVKEMAAIINQASLSF